MDANQAWLDEMPGVKASAEKYVANLETTSKTQRAAKVGAALSAIPFLYETGPWALNRAASALGVMP